MLSRRYNTEQLMLLKLICTDKSASVAGCERSRAADPILVACGRLGHLNITPDQHERRMNVEESSTRQ